MKIIKLKDRLLDILCMRLECWVHKHDPYLTTVVASSFLTVTFIGMLFLLLFLACKQVYPNEGAVDRQSADRDSAVVEHYVSPVIPDMMLDPVQRASYYVNHYWDGYSLSDTSFIRGSESEQLYANFVDALQYVDVSESRSAILAMMSLMETDSVAYARFCTLGEKYLYNPDSPLRNDEYYIPVLEHMLASPLPGETYKLRAGYHLEQCLKNRPGMKAADFSYVTASCTTGSLSSISADYTLLFFYNPGCSSCHAYELTLSGVPSIVELQEKGSLRVLAIYSEDDESEWLLHASSMPSGWIVGWNRSGDISRVLYDIRAIPTLYLLDGEKRVLLKDAPLERIIGYLAMK